MSNNLIIEPYELSIWSESKEVNSSNIVTRTVEKFMFLIGADTMDTPAAAFDIYLDEDVNGTHNLSFSLNSRYIDYDTKFKSYTDNKGLTGDGAYVGGALEENFIENPYIPYLCNEAKLKLFYQDKWYDFVVKDIQENSETYVFTYKAIDLHINELARSGFNIELSTDLQNNLGTAQELGKRVLTGTDWEVKDGRIKQYVDEPLYKAKLKQSQTAVNLETGVSKTLPSNQIIYIYYSCILTENPFFQFLVLDDPNNIKQTSSGIILNATQYVLGSSIDSFTKMTYTSNRPDTSIITLDTLESLLRGRRLVRSEKTVYDTKAERFVTEYSNGTQDVYYYQETTFQNDYPDNLLIEYTDFSNTNDWSCNVANGYSIDSNNNLIVNAVGNPVSNTSLYKNKKIAQLKKDDYCFVFLHFPDKQSLDNVTAGSSWHAYWSYRNTQSGTGVTLKYTNDSDAAITLANLYYIGYHNTEFTSDSEFEWGNNRPADLMSFFNSDTTSPLYRLRDYSNSNSGYMAVFLGKMNADFDEEKLAQSRNPRLMISTPSTASTQYPGTKNRPLIISKIDFFPYTKKWVYVGSSPQKHLTFPNNAIESSEISEGITLHTYYTYIGDEKVIVEQSPEPSTTYKPVYDNTFAKYTSIEGRDSNRFNLTQDICEKFECWAKYEVEHESDGRIKEKNSYAYFDAKGNLCYSDTNPGSGVLVKKQEKYISFLDPITPTSGRLGFKYGLNLDSIQRTVNSDQISSYTIVQDNSNEFALNGFCSIARAKENYSKENAIINLDYYTQMGLIDKEELTKDLYSIGSITSGGIGYYYNVRKYNNEIDALNEQLVKKSLEVDNYFAELDLLTLEESSKSAELAEKREEIKSRTGYSYDDIIKSGNSTNANIAALLTSTWLATLKTAINLITSKVNTTTIRKAAVSSKYLLSKASYDELKAQAEKKVLEKNKIINKFRNKYSRFLQEGTWISDDYIDDNKYYLDALKVSYTSAYPQISYTISVVDLSVFPEYRNCKYEVGMVSTMEDPKFFGYDSNGVPNREEVFITHTQKCLDSPDKNKITVQNYRTEFQDLFQRVTAAVQTLEFKGGAYQKFSNIITPEGEIKIDVLQTTVNNNKLNLQNAGVQSVEWGENGITVTSVTNSAQMLRIINNGVYITNDGGETYFNAIRGDGISASVINSGVLNTQVITVGNNSTPSFHWDSFGLSAIAFKPNSTFSDGYEYDLNKFVRFDQYGIYGINGKFIDWKPVQTTVDACLDEIMNEAHFSLTWKGFSLKTGTNSGIKISSNDDIVLYEKNGSTITEVIKIGRFGTSGGVPTSPYGIEISQSGFIRVKGSSGKLSLSPEDYDYGYGEDYAVPLVLSYTPKVGENYDHPPFGIHKTGLTNISHLFVGGSWGLKGIVESVPDRWGMVIATSPAAINIGALVKTFTILSDIDTVSTEELSFVVNQNNTTASLMLLKYLKDGTLSQEVKEKLKLIGYGNPGNDTHRSKFGFFGVHDFEGEAAAFNQNRLSFYKGISNHPYWEETGNIRIYDDGHFGFSGKIAASSFSIGKEEKITRASGQFMQLRIKGDEKYSGAFWEPSTSQSAAYGDYCGVPFNIVRNSTNYTYGFELGTKKIKCLEPGTLSMSVWFDTTTPSSSVNGGELCLKLVHLRDTQIVASSRIYSTIISIGNDVILIPMTNFRVEPGDEILLLISVKNASEEFTSFMYGANALDFYIKYD